MDDINFTVTGEADPTFVFVHGFSCSLDDWDPIIPRLAHRHRCLAIDLPGHGGSAPGPAASITALASAVNAVRHRQGTRNAILVGHSLGAKIIREAYWQDQRGIAGLVLIDGALYQGDCNALAKTMAAEIAKTGFSSFIRQHFSMMFGADFPAALRDKMVARAGGRDPAFAQALYMDAIRFDAQRGLETLLAIKTLVLALQSTEVALPRGRRSLVAGDMTPLMRAVCERTPKGAAKVIPDAGHFTMIDAPQQVADALEEFAGGLK